ncbi:MAG: sialate O-acetylesterase, partial [Planctomycetia bacterium]|nr:sialate O-acetylesterase [Planctomycetia bacterium]
KGDALAEMTGVPVAFSSVGWGGTSINWWDPDSDNESNVGHGFDRLQAAIENLDGNFTAILWHQGESDFNMA